MGALYVLAGTIFLLFAAVATVGVLRLRRLPAGVPTSSVSVSAVFAARDEGMRIETTIRRLVAQRAVSLEVVAVDDRSSDDTPRILDRLRGELPALAAVRVDTLPPGWLGKCHALHVGSSRARGEWLLFTDGDVWLGDDVVARAVAQAERDGADHVALWPRLLGPKAGAVSFAGQACLMPLAVGAGIMVLFVNRDHPRAFIGVGAFNLIRRALYERIGGHESLRMEVVDDMKLGALVRRAGGRSRAYLGQDDVLCEWASDVPGLVRGLEKNAFSGTGYSLMGVVRSTAIIVLLWLLGLSGPFVGGAAGLFAGAGLLSLAVPGALNARAHQYSPIAGALVPLVLPFPLLVLWNSMLTTLRQGGVRWRDTFYPLAELRAGVVPRP